MDANQSSGRPLSMEATDMNEMLEKVEYSMTKQLASLRTLDERIHDRLDTLQALHSVIAGPLMDLEEVLDGMSNILEKDTDLLKRLVKLRDAMDSLRLASDGSLSSSSSCSIDCRPESTKSPYSMDEFDEEDGDTGRRLDDDVPGKLYFSRQNSVLRIPIPPSRCKGNAWRKLSRCFTAAPVAHLAKAMDRECQSSFDSGIHLSQNEDKDSSTFV